MSTTRYAVDLTLITASPLHSGGAEHQVDRSAQRRARSPQGEDAPRREAEVRRFVRDGRGRPILPGRSVKGALRAAWTRAYGGRRVDGGGTDPLLRLWGDQDRASALRVHAVVLDGVEMVDRTGIAVDRYWGSAGDTALFSHEIVPAETPLALRLTGQVGSVYDDGDPEAFEQLLGQVLGLLKAGRVGLGGRRNAGWGDVRLDVDDATTSIDVTRHRLDGPDGLLALLDEDRDAVVPVPLAGEPPADERLTVTIAWDSPTGILVAEPRDKEQRGDRETIDTLPLRTRSKRGREPEGAGALVLPGSSVRGALRSRASRIARTILLADERTRERTPSDWSATGVHEQLAEDPALVRALFGSTERRGAVRVLDTLALRKARTLRRTHNAGDRWTGGVIDGGLYAEQVPAPDTQWDSITLTVDLARIGDDPGRRRAALCLLGLVLAELSTGTLPLGSRGTRGLGAVDVKALTITGGAQLLGGTWDIRAGDDGGAGVARDLLARLRSLNADPGDGTTWTDYLDGAPRAAEDAAEDGE